MREVRQYRVAQVAPYVNWLYFYHAWQVGGKGEGERESLKADADDMLRHFDKHYSTKAVVALFDACAEGDDIILEGSKRIPMLRQQAPDAKGECLCLADFVAPAGSGKMDKVALFAATVDPMMENEPSDDPYRRMLAQTLLVQTPHGHHLNMCAVQGV